MASAWVNHRSNFQHVFGCLVIWNCSMGIVFSGRIALSGNDCWSRTVRKVERRLSNGQTRLRHSRNVSKTHKGNWIHSMASAYLITHRYEIMLSCWQTIPESRSLFDKLEDRISKILDKGVSDHYVSLNEPYLSSNANYSKPKDVDYLALLGIPNIQAPSLPTVR